MGYTGRMHCPTCRRVSCRCSELPSPPNVVMLPTAPGARVRRGDVIALDGLGRARPVIREATRLARLLDALAAAAPEVALWWRGADPEERQTVARIMAELREMLRRHGPPQG